MRFPINFVSAVYIAGLAAGHVAFIRASSSDRGLSMGLGVDPDTPRDGSRRKPFNRTRRASAAGTPSLSARRSLLETSPAGIAGRWLLIRISWLRFPQASSFHSLLLKVLGSPPQNPGPLPVQGAGPPPAQSPGLSPSPNAGPPPAQGIGLPPVQNAAPPPAANAAPSPAQGTEQSGAQGPKQPPAMAPNQAKAAFDPVATTIQASTVLAILTPRRRSGSTLPPLAVRHKRY
ncbi:hypothetical protein HIM_00497 [Hirsutella minnesotensis 3608]|uniref:Uncharacterized protein n=1 Tax=Hirsutella minnesotensis 3608 TaxID=1043627 RepID=A0A0F7ZXL2_9HYPO|nr:hypothetical protein HIM_09710 [Hirsutella minnesotensis 3608]KJZ79783.1 hypothetical protein HIM_00497 [Hirsutella minnesotensis 3608]